MSERFLNTSSEKGTIYIESSDDNTRVKAQFNPKELQIDKTVPWQKVNQSNNENKQGIHLEFTGAEGRTTSIELLFDDTEGGNNVASNIKKLEHMTSVFRPGDPDETKRRPHHCVVAWGGVSFRCVIESLSTKYTMFDREGNPLRATCTVKLKEADDVKGKKADKPNTSSSPNSGGGSPAGGGAPAGPT